MAQLADELVRRYVVALINNNPDEAADVTKSMVDYVYDEPATLKFTGHMIVGGNPMDEHGCSDTKEEAVACFTDGFAKLCKDAEHKYLFVRKAPALEEHKDFAADKIMYRMIGRFSIGEFGQ